MPIFLPTAARLKDPGSPFPRISKILPHPTAWRSLMERLRDLRRKQLLYRTWLRVIFDTKTLTQDGLPIPHLPQTLPLTQYRSMVHLSCNLFHRYPNRMHRIPPSPSRCPGIRDEGCLHALRSLQKLKTPTSTLIGQNGSSSSSWLTPQPQLLWGAQSFFVYLSLSHRKRRPWLTE